MQKWKNTSTKPKLLCLVCPRWPPQWWGLPLLRSETWTATNLNRQWTELRQWPLLLLQVVIHSSRLLKNQSNRSLKVLMSVAHPEAERLPTWIGLTRSKMRLTYWSSKENRKRLARNILRRSIRLDFLKSSKTLRKESQQRWLAD